MTVHTTDPADDARIIARLHASIAEVDATAWDGLLRGQSHPTPFLRHTYLHAMEASSSACAQTGWTPCHMTLHQARGLIAACPMYLKTHSWGEYVFDFSWARAYHEHGRPYYPKALVASPFTPVPGSRLLARDAPARAQLLQALQAFWNAQALETAHALFLTAEEKTACEAAGLLLRQGVQFHWRNQHPQDGGVFTSFTHFLDSLQRDKRRKIRQEMRKVADAGVTYRHARGSAISEADWAFFYRCYETTYHEHGNAPYLTPDFWQRLQRDFAHHWLLIIAQLHGAPIACSLIGLQDETTGPHAERIAYGRYWGAVQRVDQLHFDICYYQPLAWCIANGFDRFEGGAQGEHKLARALLPETTYSAHWVRDPQFRKAIDAFVSHEREATGHYQDELMAHSPFKP